MVVEDHDAVEAVVLGDVRGGGRMFAPDAAEDVGGGTGFGAAERVAAGRLYLALQIEVHAGVQGTGGAEFVKERAFEGDTVRHLDDALLPDGIDGAEGRLDPGSHLPRRVQPPRRGARVQNAFGDRAVFGGQRLDQRGQVGYLLFGRHRLIAGQHDVEDYVQQEQAHKDPEQRIAGDA